MTDVLTRPFVLLEAAFLSKARHRHKTSRHTNNKEPQTPSETNIHWLKGSDAGASCNAFFSLARVGGPLVVFGADKVVWFGRSRVGDLLVVFGAASVV